MSGFQYLVPTSAASVQAIYSLDSQLTFPQNATTVHSLVIGNALPSYQDSYELSFLIQINNGGTYGIVISNSLDDIFNQSVASGPNSYITVLIRGTRGYSNDVETCIFWCQFTPNNESPQISSVVSTMAEMAAQDISISITCPVACSAIIYWANGFKILAP